MDSFDIAEADYLNSYKDLKDKREEEFQTRAQEIYDVLISDPASINEAVANGCAENPMFGVLLLKHKHSPIATNDLIWTFIRHYMLEQADNIAEKNYE